MPETIIDLIRHGEPVGGRAYRGNNIDDPLSETGWQQMWDAIGDVAPWDHIYCSPLQRCHAFAEAIKEKHNIPYTIDDNLKEVGFGSWEGRTPDEIKTDNLKEYQDFYNDPINNRPEGAEPLDTFIERTTTAFTNAVKQHQQKHLLIIAHAGVNRAIIAHALHTAPIGLYRINVKNAGISRLKHNELGTHLLYHNVQLTDMA